jgi:hypothetical protein
MFDRAIYLSSLFVAASFMVILFSCAVVTRSTEGSTETFQNTTDATSDLTSSTSPRDEEKKSEVQKVKMFATVNLDRLKEDMARGSGEHLTAFAHLLGVKETHQSEFFAFTKKNYSILFSSEPTTSEDMVARLNTELEAYPVWRQ